MNWQSAAFLNAAALFLGAACGSLLCLLCGKLFKKKYFKFRLSLSFVLLSAAVAFFALFVINEKALFKAALLGRLSSAGAFSLLYFCAGLLCAASVKIVFPAAALLYIAWTLSFGLFLYRKMPLPQRYSITAGDSFVRDEESGGEWKIDSDGSGAVLDWTLYELSDKALFPLPHYWHVLSGARSGSQKAAAELADVFGADGRGEGFFDRLFSAAAKRLLSGPKAFSAALPAQEVYPVIFEVRVVSGGAGFFVEAEKIM